MEKKCWFSIGDILYSDDYIVFVISIEKSKDGGRYFEVKAFNLLSEPLFGKEKLFDLSINTEYKYSLYTRL